MSNFSNNLSTYLLSNHYSEKNRIKIFKSTHIFKYGHLRDHLILSKDAFFPEVTRANKQIFFPRCTLLASI